MKLVVTLFFLAGLFLFMKDVAARQIDWVLVEKSDLIVVGTLRSLAFDTHDPVRIATDGAYYRVEVLNPVTIVGQAPQESLFVHLSSSTRVLPRTNQILFLHHVGSAPVSGFYLVDTPAISLQERSPEAEQRVATIHSENITAMRKGLAFRPSADDLIAIEVKRDLDALANPFTQQEALRKLWDKKDKAVPYLVSYLDDWRDFSLGRLAVPSTNKQGFESVLHYQPQLMIDVINLLLTQITSISFRPLDSRATATERKAVIRAWNTYLGRKLSEQ